MLFAQITDLHLGFDPGVPDEFNQQRFMRALDMLRAMALQPDLLLVTGDIVESGDDREAYARYRESIRDLPFPVYHALGNHDGRDAFFATFPELKTPDGFLHYVIEDHPVRIIVLDTLEEGRHGGAFCKRRAAWLRARLDEAPHRPTLLVLHHPPIATGIPWLTEDPLAPWIDQLRHVVEVRRNIVAIVAGHVHRPIVTNWAGTTLIVCPSTAPQVALELSPIDPEIPDERPMIIADHPYVALHRWDGSQLLTHFDTAEDHEVLARYTAKLQPLVRMLINEKEGSTLLDLP
jgi:3',5'-cyclic AMP phosphodiesterase CpdA